MDKNKGFTIAEIVLVIVVLGLIGLTGYTAYNNSKDSEEASTSSEEVTEQEAAKEAEAIKTSIYPNESNGAVSKDSYSVILPDGWSVQEVFEPYNIVKTVDNDTYLISSFIEENTDINIMEQRVAEGIETVKTVKTSLGTDVIVLKTPTTLFLASCKPTGENCYLQLKGKKLYIHLYQVIPNAQTATNIDYSSESAKQIINDFESIAKSLSI